MDAQAGGPVAVPLRRARRFDRGGERLSVRVDLRGQRLRRMLLAADAGALVLSFVLTALYARFSGGALDAPDLVLLGAAAPSWLMLAYGAGLYHVDSRRAEHGVADETGPILQMTTLWAWGLLLFVTATRMFDITVGQIAVLWGLTIVLLMFARSAARAIARRRSWYVQNAIAIGTGPDMAAIVAKVQRHPEWGINVVSCVDYAESDDTVGYVEDVPMLRGDIDVIDLIERLRVDIVIVAWSASYAHTTEERFELIRQLTAKNIHVHLVPNWVEVLGARLELQELEGMPLLSVPATTLSRSSLALKRCLDVAVSALALVAMAPLIAACALAIKLDSRGPVFYRQRRIGKDGCPFDLFKFRSMDADADARKHEFAPLNHHGGGNDEGMFKIPADPRITRVGAWLRRTSLDELPQLINILRGDMSLVGPRPLIENEDRQVAGRFRRRLQLTPGLTGLWQVHGRSDIPFEQMVNLDYLYVTSWSLWNDVKILIKTIPAVVGSRGAY